MEAGGPAAPTDSLQELALQGAGSLTCVRDCEAQTVVCGREMNSSPRMTRCSSGSPGVSRGPRGRSRGLGEQEGLSLPLLCRKQIAGDVRAGKLIYRERERDLALL